VALLAAALFFVLLARRRTKTVEEVPLQPLEKELPPPPVQVPAMANSSVRPGSGVYEEFNPYPGPETAGN